MVIDKKWHAFLTSSPRPLQALQKCVRLYEDKSDTRLSITKEKSEYITEGGDRGRQTDTQRQRKGSYNEQQDLVNDVDAIHHGCR